MPKFNVFNIIVYSNPNQHFYLFNYAKRVCQIFCVSSYTKCVIMGFVNQPTQNYLQSLQKCLFSIPKMKKIRGPGFTSKFSEKPYISNTFTLSFMCFSQRNYDLNRSRIAKHFRLLSAFSIISFQNFIIKKILKYCIIFYPVSEAFHFFKNFIPLIL